jgi:L-asparagine transporter-like permease
MRIAVGEAGRYPAVQGKPGENVENEKSHFIDRLAEASIEAVRAKRSKLNMRLMLLALANCFILLGWFLFSVAGISNTRLVLGLSVLTVLAWLWLIVIAGRRFIFWNEHERQGSNFHRWQRNFSIVAVVIFLCFLGFSYLNVDEWILQLLRKIGTDCVWCSIAPP